MRAFLHQNIQSAIVLLQVLSNFVMSLDSHSTGLKLEKDFSLA